MLGQQFPSLVENVSSLDLANLGINLAATLVLSWLLGWHFVQFGQVLTNKKKLARVLVFVSCTTLLIISVVKVSLALSLGLVGALSIIRFRTPVKEPEELAYLFLAVAIGVGMGADRRLETALAAVGILVAMALIGRSRGAARSLSSVLSVQSNGQGTAPNVQELLAAVAPHCGRVDLRRLDVGDGSFHASLVVDLRSSDELQPLCDAVRRAVPGALVSLVERTGLE
jgi:hypothetical protein